MASWTECNDESAELDRVLQRPGQRWFHLGCVRFRSWPWHAGVQACRARGARCCTLGAMQVHVHSEGNGRVHVLERECHSRCPERARALVGRGLERGPWATRAVAGHWASMVVPLGIQWRGCGRWLAVDALSPTACAWSVSARERDRGEVKRVRWLASGVVGLLLGGSSSPIGGWRWRE
jgi:hypothetical protein